MVDKDPERLKPATDLLVDSAQQVSSDRARRINSLHKQVDGLLQEETKKRRQIGGEVGSIVQQQQALRKELQLSRDEITSDVAAGYGKVVNNLGNTIKQMSIGMKNISMSTARASADAISQYGKAIGQDIHINKTNTIAMALSRATPVFGYFAAKFMETDVFRGAISKIRQGVGGAMLAGLRSAGSAISNIFRGKGTTAERIAGRERELGALSSEVASLKKELQAKPPQLQRGGYVKKGGVVEVHAAEIVAPVDTLVKQIVETTSKQQQGFLKTFVREFKMAKDPKEEAWQDRMLKAILELKVAFIGTTSRLRVAWQRTLLENPAFRGMLMFAEGFKLVLGAPIKWLFGARGGYLSDVKKATATDNVFLKVANVLGLIYTTGMPKLDAIAKYTRVSATVAAGYEPTPPMQDKYTMFQKVKGFLKGKKSRADLGLKEDAMAAFWDMLGVDEEALEGFKEAGGFRALGGLGKDVAEKGLEGAKDLGAKGKQAAEESMDMFKKQAESIFELLKLKRKQDDREKPKSKSWVEYIKMSFGKAKETAKQNIKQTKSAAETYVETRKSRKAQEKQLSFLGRMNKRLRKLGGWGWKLLMLAFTMFQGLITTGVSLIGNILGPLLNVLGIRGLFKTGGKGFLSTAGKGIKKGAKGVGGFTKKTARVQRMAGGKAAAKFAGKTALKTGLGFAGRVGLAGAKVAGGLAGGLAGGVIGAGIGLWDAIQAMRDPEGFAGGVITRAFSAFLGGRESGTSGALSGAMKLGGIGAGVGMLFGPIGAAIGGAIGAVAGGILGFIGGKNISKAISAVTGHIKKMAKATWAVVTFIPRLVKEVIKFIWKYFTETEAGKKAIEYAKNSVKKTLKVVLWPFTLGFKLASMVGDWIAKKWGEFKKSAGGEKVIALWDKVTKPFKEAWAMIGNIGTAISDMWTGTIEWIQGIIKKIQDIPFIGKFIKGIKEIHAGTWAEKKIEKIKVKEHYGKLAPAAPGGVMRPFETAGKTFSFDKKQRELSEKSVHYARKVLGAEAIKFTNGIASMAKIGGKWYKLKINNVGFPDEIVGVKKEVKEMWDPFEDKWTRGVRETPIKSELYKRKASAEELAKMAETISDKMDETTDKANKIAIGNTTVLTSNMNNTANTANGGGGQFLGGGASGSWGSGAGAATDVTYSNLN
jgi:hypothetical protein